MRKTLVLALLLNATISALRLAYDYAHPEQNRTVASAEGAALAESNGDANGDGVRDLSDAVYLLSWFFQGGPEPVALAQGGDSLTPQQEAVLDVLRVSSGRLIVSGVDLQIVNGRGRTNTTNGRGNLILGYNENAAVARSGSHNLVVGRFHGYSSYGGVVVGENNSISAPFASVLGGQNNAASGVGSSVAGGRGNEASGDAATVTSGEDNRAEGLLSAVHGGEGNRAVDTWNTVSGGRGNVCGIDDPDRGALGATIAGGCGNANATFNCALRP